MIHSVPFSNLYVTQRSLCSTEKVKSLMISIERGEPIPPINIGYGEDLCRFWVGNGHHRTTAYYLLGYKELSWEMMDLVFYEKTHRWVNIKLEDFVRNLTHDFDNWKNFVR